MAPELVAAAKGLSAATLHEASGKRGALPCEIKPAAESFTVCGPAVTVHSPGGDNLWLHRALYVAQPGDVLVVDVSGHFQHGYWGEIMSAAAQARQLGGLVINGCVRDKTLLREIGFPVFARGFCIRGTSKDFWSRGFINFPLLMGDLVVHPGDLIVGDADGVVAVAASAASAVIEAARRRDTEEAAILRRLEAGETTLDIYGWQHPRR
ncbi:MAG TPA: 4-carboxy-4-hydroxy-2-oxoadipate aldolase/oxaloacetate decarboxylase [Steroidobacteraceae bacterium]|nr:4-carboxy-4-hydroxy-2-oxoadipate aldolase/oxaloacetate decarboxylase [Steroidobacteraceae bacterium]